MYNRTILEALRTYVADHSPDWYFYTDAVTYVYNANRTHPRASHR